MDVTSLMRKHGSVCVRELRSVCVSVCVYVCDTLSQQMYVISFRGWSGEGKPERGNKNERANERKLRDLAESGLTDYCSQL